MKLSATVSTPACATAVGPSRSISRAVRRSITSRRPNTSTRWATSASVTWRRFALRRTCPNRVRPPSRRGRPPASRTLSSPSNRSQRSGSALHGLLHGVGHQETLTRPRTARLRSRDACAVAQRDDPAVGPPTSTKTTDRARRPFGAGRSAATSRRCDPANGDRVAPNDVTKPCPGRAASLQSCTERHDLVTCAAGSGLPTGSPGLPTRCARGPGRSPALEGQVRGWSPLPDGPRPYRRARSGTAPRIGPRRTVTGASRSSRRPPRSVPWPPARSPRSRPAPRPPRTRWPPLRTPTRARVRSSRRAPVCCSPRSGSARWRPRRRCCRSPTSSTTRPSTSGWRRCRRRAGSRSSSPRCTPSRPVPRR